MHTQIAMRTRRGYRLMPLAKLTRLVGPTQDSETYLVWFHGVGERPVLRTELARVLFPGPGSAAFPNAAFRVPVTPTTRH